MVLFALCTTHLVLGHRMYKMTKPGHLLQSLRLLCKQRSRKLQTVWHDVHTALVSSHAGMPLNYCKRRHFLTAERLTATRRNVHMSAVLQEREKNVQQMKEEQPYKDTDLTPQNGKQSSSAQSTSQKPPTDLEVTQRLKPPKPVKDERESSLPNHDKERITEESRRLERKANAIFIELAETRGASKETFLFAVNKFISRENVYWRGAVEFIYAGMQEMDRFGVKKDLSAYKALLQAFPEGKMIPRNPWQVEFMHYPRHQQCGIDLLEQMEYNGVIPDEAFGTLLKNRFGSEAHVTRKYRRIMYWLPKFRNINPFPIPLELPVDPRQLALLALKRMSVDRETKFDVYETVEVEEEPEEDTFIASAQSPTQQRLIGEHNSDEPLFVEGPYPVYLKECRQNYFLLRAEPNLNALMRQKELEKKDESDENLFEWTNFFEEETSSDLRPLLSVHEQDDSTILALAITGTGTKSSVVSWVRCLEQTNPRLAQTPILFKLLSSPDSGLLDVIGDNRPFRELQQKADKVSDK